MVGNYLGSTQAEQKEMLMALGLDSIEELFQMVPKEMLVEELKIPAGKSELEVRRLLTEMAAKNHVFGSIFRGAGSYHHYIPALVKQISTKEEFVTSYTPYQPEISQGVLQSIFEFQTMICEITGMEAANASVYDGQTAVAEAVNMCVEKKRTKVLLSATLHPMTIETVKTYFASRPVEIVLIPEKDGLTDAADLASQLDETVACVVIQQPNFFGGIEPAESFTEKVHGVQAKMILSVNPLVSSVLQSPGEVGADIAVGDSQPFGLPMAYGGPSIGFMATTTKLLRKLPGRIVGETTDEDGQRAFVLTLQAREQHIRREKAASNICSNQALCALTNAVYLTTMGTSGVMEVAEQCYHKAHYLAAELTKIPGVTLGNSAPFFHEFLTLLPVETEKVLAALAAADILGGYPTEKGLLWCVTEMNTKEAMDQVVKIVQEVCEQWN